MAGHFNRAERWNAIYGRLLIGELIPTRDQYSKAHNLVRQDIPCATIRLVSWQGRGRGLMGADTLETTTINHGGKGEGGMSDPTQPLKDLLAAYTELTGNRIPESICNRYEQRVYEFYKAGFSLNDLIGTIRFMQRRMRETRCTYNMSLDAMLDLEQVQQPPERSPRPASKPAPDQPAQRDTGAVAGFQ